MGVANAEVTSAAFFIVFLNNADLTLITADRFTYSSLEAIILAIQIADTTVYSLMNISYAGSKELRLIEIDFFGQSFREQTRIESTLFLSPAAKFTNDANFFFS